MKIINKRKYLNLIQDNGLGYQNKELKIHDCVCVWKKGLVSCSLKNLNQVKILNIRKCLNLIQNSGLGHQNKELQIRDCVRARSDQL